MCNRYDTCFTVLVVNYCVSRSSCNHWYNTTQVSIIFNYLIPVKVKILSIFWEWKRSCPSASHEDICRSGSRAPCLLNLGIRQRWVVSFLSPSFHRIGGGNAPQPLYTFQWTENLQSPLGIETKSLSFPFHSLGTIMGMPYRPCI